ncbi:RNA polymerase sigma factor [Cellulomonas sp. Leaf395]|uniref:RNA polymerase sigma factor n=1 Tax=Cellulomonas sp. Leaf395 TaxID=1736362 RepID=UPI0006FF1BE1|nr:RNA polymerase sigma factor [Cellulomonas sp. Leaf395]KQS98478.1 RNA polymerase subunit sigma-24 [Cellulomonas sp. Leaf395]
MTDARRTVEVIWRIESPRLIAALTRLVRDVGLAEELAQDAFVTALEQWPVTGVPDEPGAWLMVTARHRAIDLIRREQNRAAKYAVVAHSLADVEAADRIVDEPIGDDLLALVFLTCHPVLPRESRIALTLRLFGGLTTDEIARAYLVPSPTIGQRISRAKRTLAEAHVPFEVPQADQLPTRVRSVLEVLYVIFTEGHSATSGSTWVRRDLADEAMRLGRVLAGLLPREPEVFGLVALMELQASRFDARGDGVLLQDQDRRRWDRTLIEHGMAALDRATTLGRPLGPYTVQAAIAACHSRAGRFEDTDWEAIVALYDALAQLSPSPVVELNRAVAVLHADGPEAALVALDAIRHDPRLARYHLLGAVRADVLARLGRTDEAAEELERAAALAPTQRERNLLMARSAAVAESPALDVGGD